MKIVKKALPILLLVALAVLTGAGDVLKAAANVTVWQTIKTAIIGLEPFARHVLIAGIIAYLAYWRFPFAKTRVSTWSQKVVSHSSVTPRVTEVTQSAFPLIYWVVTAVLVAYALDSSVFIYTGAVLVGIGYLFKSELNHLAAGIIIQLIAKVKIGDHISFDSTEGTLLEIGPLYSRIQTAEGELRINNYDLWDKCIRQIPHPPTPPAEAKSE